jgi:hypothetical protein
MPGDKAGEVEPGGGADGGTAPVEAKLLELEQQVRGQQVPPTPDENTGRCSQQLADAGG